MVSILALYAGSFIGTLVEISIFMLVYGYFKGLMVDWTFILVYSVIWVLLFAPIVYFMKSNNEKNEMQSM